MLRYLNGKILLFTLAIGLVSYCMASLLVDKTFALWFGILFALVLQIVIPIVLYFTDKRYEDILLRVGDEILHKEKIKLAMHNGFRYGYIVLTKDKLFFFFRDKEPYIEEVISKHNLTIYKIGDSVKQVYRIYFCETAFVTLSERSTAVNEMKNLGFIE